MYSMALVLDALVQKTLEGGLARMPTKCDASFLPVIGSDRLIGQGLTESVDSYRVRLQKAFEAWQLAGSARSVLVQTLGYLLALTPMVRMVSSRYSGNVADLLFITDATNTAPIQIVTKRPSILKTGDTVTISGVGGNTAANTTTTIKVTGARAFTLDGTTGNATYTPGTGVVASSVFPTVYPMQLLSTQWDTYAAGQDPQTAPLRQRGNFSGGLGIWDWDSVSQVIGSWGWWGAWLIVYAVAPNAWAHEASWLIGDTSLTIGTLPGSIGLDVTWDVIASIRLIAGQFKGAHSWIRWIIVSLDASLFDPVGNASVNPDGTFGKWSKVVNNVYVPSRFANARYCDGVI
jgi:hypothetical protein